jgi:NAD(P)-dependent dehydrogenase (short-subunit alcohol dehydrogenase family)
LSARRRTELEETARLCIEARTVAKGNSDGGMMALTVVGDVTKEEDVKALFECGVAEYGASFIIVIRYRD